MFHRCRRAFATTAHRFPYLKRESRFSRIQANDIDVFKSIVGGHHLLVHQSTGWGTATDDDLMPYNQDWMRKYQGQSQVVLKPKTTKEVSAVLKHCNDRQLAVVPQGGNTGLVGGSVPVFDEIVLSLQSMNAVMDFDAGSGTLVCQAGCILEVLDHYVAERGCIMPLDLGAKGSCHIGGNLATNAGGLRLLRYGNLHGSVLGLEAVLADGTVLNGLSTLRKDNTGYDLKQLFIGSEGTLGVITAVSIQTPQRPKAVNVALLGVSSFEQVQRAFERTRGAMGEILSAFEFWDHASFALTQQHLDVRQPLADAYPFYVLVESSGSDKEHDDIKMARLLESLMEEEVVLDGALAQDETQAQSIWSIREGIPEACSKSGAVLKYDISMPVPVLYKLVEDMRQRLKDKGLLIENDKHSMVRSVIGYGHMGDGNLHLNISAQSYAPEVVAAVEPFVYEWTQKHRGSVSAEHGLGLMKANCIGYSKSPEMIDTMRKIKHLFDPKGIMNPYKFLPSSE